MQDLFNVDCPYCGETIEVYVEPDMRGRFVMDCEVCCHPWSVRIIDEDGDRYLDVHRSDGFD